MKKKTEVQKRGLFYNVQVVPKTYVGKFPEMAAELEEMVTLGSITTQCPGKWLMVDRQTGQVYTFGKNGSMKLLKK